MATTSAGPWSVKGVDPKAREIAKDLARRSNMTLGEWLNRFIADTGETPEAPRFQSPLNLEAAGGRVATPGDPADRVELKKLIGALSALSARLDRSEADAGAALGAMRQSYHELESRLSSAEARISETDAGAVERRFEALAAELHEKVEAGRAEIATRLREAAEGQFEKVEGALRDLSGHIEQTERRSARAIAGLGHEMMRVAQMLNGRVASVESRSTVAVERASGEIARVAETVEGRMGQAEQVQAEALERLGSEISRIAERLADRIAGSERRSAAAIDDIGLQVNQAADRIDQRYERANTEVADRLKQTEERTSRLLEEARDRFDLRMAEGARRTQFQERVGEPAPAVAPVPAPVPATPSIAARMEATPAAVFSDLLSDPASPEAEAVFEPIHDFSTSSADPFGPLPPLEPMQPFSEGPLFEPAAEEQPAAAEGVVAAAESVATFKAAEPFAPSPAVTAPPAPAEPERPKTTRELLESARAAARQAAATPAKGAEKIPAAGQKRFSLTLPKLKRKDAGLTLRTAVVASGTAAAICVTAVGAFKVYGGAGAARQDYAARDRNAPMASLTPTAAPQRVQPPVDLAGAPSIQAPGLAAVALTPSLATPAGAHSGLRSTAAAPPEANTPDALYAVGVRRIESGDARGLAEVMKAANHGLAPAQLYLAKLYESGAGGMRKDMVQARRWTARAAQGGDVKAMHNLGLYYFEGDGGEQNIAAAADWFKRAAELGLPDSQYNLARLYQQGTGVGQNPAEAYKWYLVAAANGDAGARNDAAAVRKTIGADEAAAAERSAAMLQAQARNGTAVTPTP